MVLWNEIETPVTHLPVRFQIPRGYSEYGKSSQYNLIQIDLGSEKNTQFIEWFQNLEKTLVKMEPLESRIKGTTISVKYVDGFTQVFDESNKFIFGEEVSFADSHLDCLVEIDKVYSLNGVHGITCKIFQVRKIPNKEDGCLFGGGD